MAINFPSTPGDGEEYTDANSGTWVYDSGTNSWTLTAGGSTSAFNFRGGHDFTSSTPPADPIESGDMWIHDAPDGTVDAVYTGISGQIGNGQLVLWDGNSYVMVSGTLPGYPDVGDGEGGTHDSRYLKLGANAGDQIVASTDTTTFNGLVEAGSGVEVTGGHILTVNNGIVYSEVSRSLSLLQNGIQGAAVTAGQFVVSGPGNPLENNPSAFIITGYITPKADGTANPYVFCNFPGLTGTANNFTLNNASFNTTGGGTVTNQCIGYDAARSLDRVATTNIAYRGRLRSQSERNNFNFYTEGDASNFFEGDTYIGGTATRSTRELWESTLTEEEKEQLAAGTLAIPANVSTPGDGSFVRQWWYDQQSAEDQALIDSGELDYPERYQAANFVDTFELGIDTNIDLLSTGEAHFGGNVGIGTKTPTDILTIKCGKFLANRDGGLRFTLNDTNDESEKNVYRAGIKSNATGQPRFFIDYASDSNGDSAEALCIANTTGYVGIGTTAPQSELDVDGSIKSSGGVEGADGTWAIAADGTATGITVTRASVVTDEQAGTIETLLDIITDLRARVAALEADHATLMNNNNGGY